MWFFIHLGYNLHPQYDPEDLSENDDISPFFLQTQQKVHQAVLIRFPSNVNQKPKVIENGTYEN